MTNFVCLWVCVCPDVVNTVKKFLLFVGWRWELHEILNEVRCLLFCTNQLLSACSAAPSMSVDKDRRGVFLQRNVLTR